MTAVDSTALPRAIPSPREAPSGSVRAGPSSPRPPRHPAATRPAAWSAGVLRDGAGGGLRGHLSGDGAADRPGRPARLGARRPRGARADRRRAPGRPAARRLAAAGRRAARLRREPRAGRRPGRDRARHGAGGGRPLAGRRRPADGGPAAALGRALVGGARRPGLRQPLRRDAAGPRRPLGAEPAALGPVRPARRRPLGGRAGHLRALSGGAAVAGGQGRRDRAGRTAQRRGLGGARPAARRCPARRQPGPGQPGRGRALAAHGLRGAHLPGALPPREAGLAARGAWSPTRC